MIRFAMSRITGNSGWPTAGTLGSALARLELGDMNGAARDYRDGKRYLKSAIRNGDYLPIL